jgi:hypothetical protein
MFDYLSSHRMAFATMLLGMLGLLLRLLFPQQIWLSDSPLYLLVSCLILSLLYHWRRFVTRPLMLLFHLSLMITLTVMLLSPHFRASGYFELAEGQTLHDKLIFFEGGRFASQPPADWALTQEAIHAEYRYGSVGKTINTRLIDHKQKQPVPVGFMQAAYINGYRIEPTGNMGYAAVFSYTDQHGKQTRGVVNFPGYPTRSTQTNPFKSPAGKWTNATLEMDSWPYREKQPWTLDIPASVRIKLKTEQTMFILKPGEVQTLPSGKLKLEKVTRWLGYKLSRDPLAPFIFISSLLGCLSLILSWLQSRKIEIVKWNKVFSTSG